MNTTQPNTESHLTIFLLGALFNILASIQIASLFDYAFKAMVGGVIWLAFKLLGDFLSQKYIFKKRDSDEKPS